MSKRRNITFAALAATATLLASSGNAFAWGCIAVSENGTYGYSYNYDDQNDAIDRALTECAQRATTDQTCEITECDPDT